MNNDIIFHAVSKRKWPEYNRQGAFNPTGLPDREAVIKCTSSEGLQEYLNNGFKGRKNLLLLVIDRFRVDNRITKGEKRGEWLIQGAENIETSVETVGRECKQEGVIVRKVKVVRTISKHTY